MTRIRAITQASTVLALSGLALCLAGCTSSASPAASTSTATATAGPSGSITVFAAASLTATFTTLGADFEKANPGSKVQFDFAGSSDLVTQIVEGAPADVFASADEANMAKVTAAALNTGAPVAFATNVLEIAVPPDNPANITDFASLAKSGTKVVVCASAVPCGAAAIAVEKKAGVTLSPVSEESSVTDVLGKVTSGEADAGLVYVTDVKGAGSTVKGINFPEAADVVNTYPIVPLSGSKNAALAKAFTAYVTSGKGQSVLAAAGFGKP